MPWPGGISAGPDVIEKNEGADHPAFARRERAPHAEPAQIARARLDDQRDGIDGSQDLARS